MEKNIKGDWVECKLGDICFTTSGGTPRRSNKSYFEGDIPWVKSGELDKGIIYDTEEHISDEALKKSSAKLFPKGTLLIALYGATIGKMALLGVEAATNQAICGIYKSEVIKTSYLYHYLLFKKNKLIGQGTGGAQPNISQTILKQLEVKLPPLPIQRAIVAKIEELFSSLDSCIADLKKAQEQLVIYRQAVLKKAFEGDYEIVELREVIKKIEAGKSFRCDERPPNQGEVGIVKVSALTWGNFQEDESKTVTDSSKINPKYFIEKGDFLLSRANTIELVGNSVIVKNITKTLMLSDKSLRIIFKQNINPFYALRYLNSVNGKKQIQLLSTGNQDSMRNIGQERIKQITLPLPNQKEQHQIVRELESRPSVCDKVEESIAESLKKAEALRQSILKKAFEGKLLNEDEVAKCKLERDYEPASVLLERIKEEKKK